MTCCSHTCINKLRITSRVTRSLIVPAHTLLVFSSHALRAFSAHTLRVFSSHTLRVFSSHRRQGTVLCLLQRPGRQRTAPFPVTVRLKLSMIKAARKAAANAELARAFADIFRAPTHEHIATQGRQSGRCGAGCECVEHCGSARARSNACFNHICLRALAHGHKYDSGTTAWSDML